VTGPLPTNENSLVSGRKSYAECCAGTVTKAGSGLGNLRKKAVEGPVGALCKNCDIDLCAVNLRKEGADEGDFNLHGVAVSVNIDVDRAGECLAKG